MSNTPLTMNDFLKFKRQERQQNLEMAKKSVALICQRDAAIALRDKYSRALETPLISNGSYISKQTFQAIFSANTFFYLLGMSILFIPLTSYLSASFTIASSIIIGILLALILRIFWVIMRTSFSTDLNEYKKFRAYMIANEELIASEWKSKGEEIQRLNKQISDKTQCIIPDAYINVAAILLNYIESERADNIKEAINLYNLDKSLKDAALRIGELEEQLRHQARLIESIDDKMDSVQSDIDFNNAMHFLGYF